MATRAKKLKEEELLELSNNLEEILQVLILPLTVQDFCRFESGRAEQYHPIVLRPIFDKNQNANRLCRLHKPDARPS